MPNSEIESFVLAALEAAGATLEPLGYSLTDALLPEDLATKLGGAPLLRLTFDSEVAQEDPDAVLVTYGHPLVDSLVEHTLTQRRGFQLYSDLTPDACGLSPDRALNLLNRAVTFQHARPPQFRSSQYILASELSVGFRVRYQSATRVEEFINVWVDAEGTILGDVGPIYTQQPWTFRLPAQWAKVPFTPPDPVDQILTKARAHAEGEAAKRAQEMFASDRAQYDSERARTIAYYEQTMNDLKTKAKTADDTRRDTLDGRYQAALADRDRRLADLENAYTVHHEVFWDYMAWHVFPKLIVSFTVQSRDRQLSVDALYNPLTRTLEPPRCGQCGNPAQDLSWRRTVWVGACCRRER